MANEKKQSGGKGRKNRSGLISRREFTISSMAMFGAATVEPGKAAAKATGETPAAFTLP